MPKFAANLSMLFTELPFLERFEAASEAGFKAVEYLFPYDFTANEVVQALQTTGLTQALFNLPPGNWEAGDRGTAALGGRRGDFQNGLEQALEYARALDCRLLHAMAGIAPQNKASEQVYIDNIRYAADRAAEAEVSILLEPINPRDMPGYFLGSVRQAVRLIDLIDRENVRLQLDLYHAQITDGDITRLIQEVMSHIAHIQIASVPERHEPDRGELYFPHVIETLCSAGYDGWIGCEYRPSAGTFEGLSWLQNYSVKR